MDTRQKLCRITERMAIRHIMLMPTSKLQPQQGQLESIRYAIISALNHMVNTIVLGGLRWLQSGKRTHPMSLRIFNKRVSKVPTKSVRNVLSTRLECSSRAPPIS
jgi:hypothetical protein